MNTDIFFDGMTRHEVCQAYANDFGLEFDFTDHDWEWSGYYEMAESMSDADLLLWCKENL